MIEAMTAAASAVSLVAPALIEIAKGGAEKLGETAAGKLLAWLRKETTGPAREAMIDLEREPTSPDNLADLRKQLTKLLTQEPALLAELIKLLPAPVATGDRLEQHVEGAGAKAVQFHGNRNTITIS